MLVVDIEANGLRPTKIHCCCCYDPATKTFKNFHEDSKEECKKTLESCELIVMHNGCDYDCPALKRLWGVNLKVKQVYDTIVMSRLADPKRSFGHSLRAWGEHLGILKGHQEDWDEWSPEMEKYCENDCLVTFEVYKAVEHELQGFSDLSKKIEMRSQWILSKQRETGFPFDAEAAVALKNTMQSEYFPLIQKLQTAFPPRKVLVGAYKARRKQDGSLTAKSAEIVARDNVEPTETPDVYNVYEYKEFMIDSPQEIVERMKPYWHPVIWNKPTKTGKVTPKVCDENLETVGDDAPEAIKDIVRCKILKSRSTLVQSFIDACWEDGRVHGDVISVGASSHRMAHRNPNCANLPSHKSLYGSECRALFKAPEGFVMVGCDLSGIQLRAMAHYCNDQELIKQILEGDIHTHLAKIYGLIPENATAEESLNGRTRGKTITYCILMGGGSAKVGQLAGGDAKLGLDIMKRLSSGIHGWSKFKSLIELRAQIGWFRALDGRRVKLPNAHLGTALYLQSFEQAIMKLAMYLWTKEIKKRRLSFQQCVVVHDEVDGICKPEEAEEICQIINNSMKKAGEMLGSKIRIDGEYKIGKDWLEVH